MAGWWHPVISMVTLCPAMQINVEADAGPWVDDFVLPGFELKARVPLVIVLSLNISEPLPAVNPKPILKVAPAPKPKPVVEKATPTDLPARMVTTSPSWSSTAAVWAKYPSWVEKFALCVAHHESWSAGLWLAENPTSTASGAFQWIDGSWQASLRRAGMSGPSHASDASATVQAKVTAYAINSGQQFNWAGSGCGYGT